MGLAVRERGWQDNVTVGKGGGDGVVLGRGLTFFFASEEVGGA